MKAWVPALRSSVEDAAPRPGHRSNKGDDLMDSKTHTAPIEALEELLNERYSVRAFRPDPVPREMIDHVLNVAQRTASWCNSQPWQVLIASGEARERFRKLIYAEAASGGEDGHDGHRCFLFPPPARGRGIAYGFSYA